jgi:murein DD-endopeptidase MepM/ murein hydrolase activator NlpD
MRTIDLGARQRAQEQMLMKLLYRVRSGDTLSGLAQQYGTRWQDIYAANRDTLDNPNKIVPGQQLRIPTATTTPEPITPKPPPKTIKPTGEDIPVYPAAGFVFHHSGGSTLSSLRATLEQRGLGSQYLMDRDGTIYNFAGAGSPHIRPNDLYHGRAPGLSNENAVGMEVVARDNHDVTPAQVEAARKFIDQYYPDVPVYGHGEVNPGHKQADEGMAIVNAIRSERNATPLGMTLASNADLQ